MLTGGGVFSTLPDVDTNSGENGGEQSFPHSELVSVAFNHHRTAFIKFVWLLTTFKLRWRKSESNLASGEEEEVK